MKIKKLEWVEKDGWWEAGGMVVIEHFDEIWYIGDFIGEEDEYRGKDYKTKEEAMQAAQELFEEWIRSWIEEE